MEYIVHSFIHGEINSDSFATLEEAKVAVNSCLLGKSPKDYHVALPLVEKDGKVQIFSFGDNYMGETFSIRSTKYPHDWIQVYARP